MQHLLELEKTEHAIIAKEHFYYHLGGNKRDFKQEIFNFCIILVTQK